MPNARPLLQTEWPEGYWSFYKRLVEQKGSSEGGRDFVRLLRCHMQHGGARTAQAIWQCSEVGLISADAVLQLVAQARYAPKMAVAPLDLTEHPTLRSYTVELEETARYQILLGEQANEHCVA